MQHSLLDPKYRLYCNPYFGQFLFYADNTVFQTNELFEITQQIPIENFPFTANTFPFGPAYRYTTMYFEGRVIAQVLNKIFEFKEASVREIANLPLQITEEADTFGKLAPVGTAITFLHNGLLQIAKPPEFNFKPVDMPFPATRNFGFIRSSVLYSSEEYCECYLSEGKLTYTQQESVETDFLCCSGGLMFLERDEIFQIVDVQSLKTIDGPESHVRDFDEIVKLYTCGVLPGTFLRLTHFHVQNFETKFGRWRKTVDEDRRFLVPRRLEREREPIQRIEIVEETIERTDNALDRVSVKTQTEDSECISLRDVLATLNEDSDTLNGPQLVVKVCGQERQFKCQLDKKIYAFYKKQEKGDQEALNALENLVKLSKK